MTTTINGNKVSVRTEGLRNIRLPWNGRDEDVYCATYGVYEQGNLIGWVFEPKELLPARATLGIRGAVLATNQGLENIELSSETKGNPTKMQQYFAYKAYHRVHKQPCATLFAQ